MKLFYVGVLIPLSITPFVYAEDTSTLDDMTVTARPIGLQSIEHIAQPINVLNKDELAEKQASTLGETLENIPGVTTNRFSPLASRPVIRGLSGSRVQVLENGIGSMDVSTISVDHAVTIDPLQAEQVEIFRGPSTLLYGSEASGGLVNVVTNKIPEYVPDSFSPKLYSSYNTNSLEKLVSFQAEGGYEKMAFHVDALNRDARNYEAKDGQIDNSFYDVNNFNFGASFVDDWGHFGMSYGRFDSTHGVPLNPDDPTELPFIDTQQDRIDLSTRINNPFSGIKAINIQGSYNDYSHTEFEDATTPGTVFSNEQLEGRVEIQHAPISVFNGVIGTQFGYRDVSAVGDEAFLPKTNTENFAIFILEDTDIIDDVHFEIGGRYEHQESDPDNAGSVSNDLYSVSSGIHWHFIEEVSLGLNVSRSQRAPAAEERFANGPHVATSTFELGQSTLDKETANNIDLTLTREEGILKWNLSLFANYIEDFIFLQGLDRNNDGAVDEVDETGAAPGKFTLVQYQQDNAVFYGFEAAASLNLYSGNRGILDLNLFGDYVRAERENGDNLSRISPARVGTGLDYQYKKFAAGLDLTNVFAQNDNGQLEKDTGGYSLLNLNANYDVIEGDQNLNIFLKASNLLDEDGELHTSFIKNRAPIMGRALTIGLQASF
ncbi:MAG: TonB-dependent receptor [Proteobacteria bacterium]|nr:TonB-dependent receptor [Pseudomonadota bacterium]NOG61073.1 TonB-dependent receptor [Pseudomonadota bacterium]